MQRKIEQRCPFWALMHIEPASATIKSYERIFKKKDMREFLYF